VKVVVVKEWGMDLESLGGGFENLKFFESAALRRSKPTVFLNLRRSAYGATLPYGAIFAP
jgi:hypothetical protein